MAINKFTPVVWKELSSIVSGYPRKKGNNTLIIPINDTIIKSDGTEHDAGATLAWYLKNNNGKCTLFPDVTSIWSEIDDNNNNEEFVWVSNKEKLAFYFELFTNLFEQPDLTQKEIDELLKEINNNKTITKKDNKTLYIIIAVVAVVIFFLMKKK